MENVVARHYDLLIDEGNDPVLDPPALAAYMDGWDGGLFIDALCLDGTQDVLDKIHSVSTLANTQEDTDEDEENEDEADDQETALPSDSENE